MALPHAQLQGEQGGAPRGRSTRLATRRRDRRHRVSELNLCVPTPARRRSAQCVHVALVCGDARCTALRDAQPEEEGCASSWLASTSLSQRHVTTARARSSSSNRRLVPSLCLRTSAAAPRRGERRRSGYFARFTQAATPCAAATRRDSPHASRLPPLHAPHARAARPIRAAGVRCGNTAAMPRAFEEAVAGAAAGCTGTLLGYPLDTVKARLQVGRSGGAWSCVRSIAATEGGRGFYRGVTSPLLSMTLLNVVCFQSYAATRQLLSLPPVAPPSADPLPSPPGSGARRFAAGALVSPLVTFISTPFELVKVQLQLDAGARGAEPGAQRRFAGAADAARAIAAQRGAGALWLGARVNLVREGLFLGTYFWCYESVRDGLCASGVAPGAAVPVAGGLSGALAWVVSFPLDVIKNNVQGQSLALLGTPQQLHARDVAATLWRTNGVRGLFRGVTPSVLRAFLVSGSRFSAYEGALELLRSGD